jgi:uncharacterized protein DUF6496
MRGRRSLSLPGAGRAGRAGRRRRREVAKQGPKQREIVGRVMHEFKHGDLESSSGRKVKNPRQAIAIALHEAGASRNETPARNRRNLARTEEKERRAQAGRAGGGKKASAARSGGAGQTRAALYDEATKRGIPGRSRMTKEQLATALGRR